mgnify:CR=1 FL=1
MFTIAIVGRPNVGKSTLFNKLVGKELAIVNDYAGVTRDRKEAIGILGNMEFKVIDTAGWNEDPKKNTIESEMVKQTETAIKIADICLFLLDGKDGVQPTDQYFANKLRNFNKNCILLVNKCDTVSLETNFDKEFYKLGFGNPVAISAEHKNGFNLLYDSIEPYYNEYRRKTEELEDLEGKLNNSDNENSNSKDDCKPLQLAIVGRPNSGKSTLINRLLNEDRVITGEEAGITRDSIAIDWEYNGRKIKLIDTAGIRKKRNITEELEKYSVEESMRAIKFAQVVLMMVDANNLFDTQDLAITSILVKEGRGVVFVLNKWDLVEDKHKLMNKAIKIVEENSPELKGCPIIPISAKDGTNIDKLMRAVFSVFADWDKHVPTSKLNQWLRLIESENPPPLFRGQTTRLKYMTQAKTRPPTFALFTNSPNRLESTSYNRFIINRLRKDFNLQNTMVRLILKKADNPYDRGRK